MSELNTYDMNIYVISQDCGLIIEKIKESCKTNKKNDDKHETNITSFWKLIPIKGSLSLKIKELFDILKSKIDACTQKKDVFKEIFIIDNKNISKENIEDFFELLNNILDENGDYYHPFIIFLTKEEIVINNEEYYNLDIKKFNFFLYPEDKDSLSILVFKLIQICSYYNELGDFFEVNGCPYQSTLDVGGYPTYLNVLIMGRSQSGKSTFINLLLNEKRAKEGGNSCGCTEKTVKYKILNYPIKLYDTIGFGDEDKNVEDILNFFKKMDEEFSFSKEKIHLILYFIDGGAGNKFSKNEKVLLEEIQKRNILTFYIVNKFEFDPKQNLKRYNNELKKIYRSLTSFIGSNYFSTNEEENLRKFIGVNLVKQSPNKPIFGFKSIINNIYKYFKEESKIFNEILEQYIREKEFLPWDELLTKLKKNFFFSHLQHYEELEQKYNLEARNAIKKKEDLMKFLAFIPIGDIINKFLYNSLKNKVKTIYNIDEDLYVNSLFSLSDVPSMIPEKLERLALRYKEEFRKHNIFYIYLLMDTILQGINFFEKLNSNEDQIHNTLFMNIFNK